MRRLALALCLLPLPAMAENVYDFAADTPGFSRFASLMRQTGIDRALSNPGPYTIFAPEDAAFSALPQGLDREALVQILTCHMVPSRVVTGALATNGAATVRTVGGCRLTLQRTAQGVIVTDDAGHRHQVVAGDIRQSNGVVHAINSLILPPE